ncbi:hypothetical protein NST99_24135 [Paenibacillus sp. FSL L8-0470]
MGLTEKCFGNIYFWTHDEDTEDMGNMYFISENFKVFLENLYD